MLKAPSMRVRSGKHNETAAERAEAGHDINRSGPGTYGGGSERDEQRAEEEEGRGERRGGAAAGAGAPRHAREKVRGPALGGRKNFFPHISAASHASASARQWTRRRSSFALYGLSAGDPLPIARVCGCFDLLYLSAFFPVALSLRYEGSRAYTERAMW